MADLDALGDIANNIMGNTICAFGEGTAMPAMGLAPISDLYCNM